MSFESHIEQQWEDYCGPDEEPEEIEIEEPEPDYDFELAQQGL